MEINKLVKTFEIIFENMYDAGQIPTTSRQAICLVEEVGEFIKEWRRYNGWSRHNADNWDALQEELADVIITAIGMAVMLEIPIEKAIHDKLNKILERGGY